MEAQERIVTGLTTLHPHTSTHYHVCTDTFGAIATASSGARACIVPSHTHTHTHTHSLIHCNHITCPHTCLIILVPASLTLSRSPTHTHTHSLPHTVLTPSPKHTCSYPPPYTCTHPPHAHSHTPSPTHQEGQMTISASIPSLVLLEISTSTLLCTARSHSCSAVPYSIVCRPS